MTIRLLCVSKPRDALLLELHERYAERIRKLGIRYSEEWVPEVKSGGRYTEEHARRREADALLDRAGDRSTLIALDAAGELFDSQQLASRLERWASPTATLIVGGPTGLHDILLRRTDVRWSLSRSTFPHELVRVLIAEQIYRSLALQRGLPYAK